MTDSIKLFKLHSEFRHDIDNDEFVSSWNDVLLLFASVQGTFFYYNLSSQSARLPRFYLTVKIDCILWNAIGNSFTEMG